MTENYGSALFPQHQEMLIAVGITADHARTRGYRSQDTKAHVSRYGFSGAGCNVPGLLIPSLGADGKVTGFQYRPDKPRQRNGRAVKYETPVGQRNGIDIPPGVGTHLGNPNEPLWITEGVKKADSAAVAGLVCVALPGVWSWRGTNGDGGRTAVGDWHDIALNGRPVILAFDSDVTGKPAVKKALDELARYLASKGAKIEYCHLPNDGDGKTGLDDYLAGHTVAELQALVTAEAPVVDPIIVTGALRKHWRMALRYADEHTGKVLHVVGVGWHYWDGRRWAVDAGGVRATRAVADTVRAAWREAATMSGDERKAFHADIGLCETASGTKGLLELGKVIDGLTATTADLDADPFLLNTATGTVDLRTAEQYPHDPADWITKVANGGYDPAMVAPTFAAFLLKVLPDDETRLFVQRFIGAALLGIVREHSLAILTGAGQNGKTTFVEAVGYALGGYYLAAPPGLLTETKNHQAHPTEMMTLLGKRLVTLVETDKGDIMSVERMKRLTGGDTIPARLLYQNWVEFTPSHSPVMVTNHLPQVPADDPAVWRRLLVVPFDVRVTDAEKDPELPERLQLEADGILSWAIAGYADYSARGGLDPPMAVSLRTAKYQAASDVVSAFLEDVCTVEVGNDAIWARQSAVWEAWSVWCRNNAQVVGRQKDLVAALQKRKIPQVKTSMGQTLRGLAVNQ